jgi:glucokinase
MMATALQDPTPNAPTVLVADIGGTFARFALARDGALVTEPVRIERASFADLPQACLRFLAQPGTVPIDGAAIAAAGQVHGDRIEMTNASWAIDARELERALGLPHGRVLVLNDFGALAWALPTLSHDELVPLGSAGTVETPGRTEPLPEGNRVIVGPGTGLGVAAAIRIHGPQDARDAHRHGRRGRGDPRLGTGWLPLATEGGHATFAPETAIERRAAAIAAHRHGRVSWERVVSGPGLELLHDAARDELGLALAPADAARIVEAARRGDDPAALLAVDAFIALVGAFAGDLALLFNASGGVVIAGGVLPRLVGAHPFDGLRARFEDKGRFAPWLRNVPTSLLDSPFAALRGAALAWRG